jgi:fatty acid desaturase
MASRERSILARQDDFHCVAYHLLSLGAYAAAFWLYLHPEVAGIRGPLSRLAFVLGAAVMLGWISGIDVGVNFHNHVHRPVFRIPWLNVWFGRLWTFSGGWPSYFWEHAHITVHHANLLEASDWTLPKRKADGSTESIYAYSIYHWPWRYWAHLFRDFVSGRGGPGSGTKALRELGIFLALWSIPFWIDPVMALGLWVLPQYLANVAVMAPGMYVQHVGCVPRSEARPLSHSNTFVNRFFNLTMFNIGYHIEHHDNPNVHWAALPALHERLKARLIEQGGHVVPVGYYRAGRIFCAAVREPSASEEFERQHPSYVRHTTDAAVVPADGLLGNGAMRPEAS